MRPLLLAALLLAGSAFAADWSVGYRLKTKADKTFIDVRSGENKTLLCQDFTCTALDYEEARQIAYAILAVTPGEAKK